MQAWRGTRDIALLILNFYATPRPLHLRERVPVPNAKELGGSKDRVWRK